MGSGCRPQSELRQALRIGSYLHTTGSLYLPLLHVCSPGRKGRADLTSSPPSSHLTVAVSTECPASPDGNYGEGLRSLWHLSRHLTARADDNHAAPSQRPRRASLSPNPSSAIQARVRFLAYHRIKPHVPPLVRAPVNSFEFHRCRRTPQVGCLMLSLGR